MPLAPPVTNATFPEKPAVPFGVAISAPFVAFVVDVSAPRTKPAPDGARESYALGAQTTRRIPSDGLVSAARQWVASPASGHLQRGAARRGDAKRGGATPNASVT